MIDLTHTGNKITVLRGFKSNLFLVVQGNSFYDGLKEKYQEFSDYQSAIDYFNSILLEVK